MSFTQVQKTSFVSLGAPGTISKAYGSSVTKGNLLLAIVISYTGNSAVPTDTLSSAWKQAGSPLSPSNQGIITLFYAIAPSSGANTVSCVVTGATNDISIAEYTCGSPLSSTSVLLDQTIR